MIWVDLGGGTAENVDMMAQLIDLASFDKIYVVDMCAALCKVAREKVRRKGWSNVEIVEGDACTFKPTKQATLVTFSYSLSSNLPIHFLPQTLSDGYAGPRLVGHAREYLHRRWF